MTQSEGWAPDPTGRHRHRYHRNGVWTDEVSDGDGLIVLDPYHGAKAATPKPHGSWPVPKWLVAVACLAVIYTVAKNEGVGQTCAVTALGQKLCGNELRAWCNATDDIRDSARDVIDDSSAFEFDASTSSIDEAQRICDEVR